MSASIVAIVGPTAVGKSAVADRVARALDTDVLSVDAMQVYRGMDIGTAKTPVNERLVPLRLVDLVDPAVNYSAALFQRDARCEIERLRALGKPVVLCGGTGLYLRAALDEMDFPQVRRRAKREYAMSALPTKRVRMPCMSCFARAIHEVPTLSMSITCDASYGLSRCSTRALHMPIKKLRSLRCARAMKRCISD